MCMGHKNIHKVVYIIVVIAITFIINIVINIIICIQCPSTAVLSNCCWKRCTDGKITSCIVMWMLLLIYALGQMLAETKKKEQLIYCTTHKMMLTRSFITVCNENRFINTKMYFDGDVFLMGHHGVYINCTIFLFHLRLIWPIAMGCYRGTTALEWAG